LTKFIDSVAGKGARSAFLTWIKRWPVSLDLRHQVENAGGSGVLAFAKNSELDRGLAALLFPKPWFAKTWVIVVADASVVAFLFAGIWLVAFRRRT